MIIQIDFCNGQERKIGTMGIMGIRYVATAPNMPFPHYAIHFTSGHISRFPLGYISAVVEEARS